MIPNREEDHDDRSKSIMARHQGLPDDVIRQIIPSLPTKSAFGMSFLFKRFQGVWSTHPVIDLDDGTDLSNKAVLDHQDINFTNILESYLNFRKNINPKPLDKLRLRMKRNPDREAILDQWLSFAAERSIKELDLSLTAPLKGFKDYYSFSSKHFDVMKSLVRLNLEYVTIKDNDHCDGVHLPCLKTMSLKNVNFYYEWFVHKLIQGCVSMENLSLTSCSCSSTRLTVPSSSVKCLEIRDCDIKYIQILCKTLESFTLVSGSLMEHVAVSRGYSLRYINIQAEHLKRITLLECKGRVEATLHTPNLMYFSFNYFVPNNLEVIHQGLCTELCQAMLKAQCWRQED